MGFFARLKNLLNGFLGLFIKGLEADNPEIVYEAAIEKEKIRYAKLQKSAAALMRMRNEYETKLKEAKTELERVTGEAETAVNEGEDEVAVILIQRKNELIADIESYKAEYESATIDVEKVKQDLIEFKGRVKQLIAEKDKMLAVKASAESKLRIQRSLDGLSSEPDLKALDSVRDSIKNLQAEANVAQEMAGSSLDGKMKQIREKTKTTEARKELEEMKKRMAAKQAEGAKNM